MSLDRPDPPPTTRRRPFDELIAELAERTGRPLWKVTRVPPTEASRQGGKASAGKASTWQWVSRDDAA